MSRPRQGGRRARPDVQRALRDLHDRPFNVAAGATPETSGDGWQVDHYRQVLPAEPPGAPVPGGSWQVARRFVRDYAFADSAIIRAAFDPREPLEGRNMLLEGRFLGLRFHLGVRVDTVVDDRRQVDGRPVRVWGWGYRTLEGHLEAGRMDYEVWKWEDTGEVAFRTRRTVRTADIPRPVIRLGWAAFGRVMQLRFARRACARMQALVVSELARAPTPEADTARRSGERPTTAVFGFRFAPLYRAVGALFGVRPGRAWIVVAGGRLQIRFGPWFVDTPTANVVGWLRTGPFRRLKTLGPAHLSLVDQGLTCATNPALGVCIRFREPVGGMDPRHRLRHPAITVTPADVAGLEAALQAAQAPPGSSERPGSGPA